jgi:hypothetical protein
VRASGREGPTATDSPICDEVGVSEVAIFAGSAPAATVRVRKTKARRGTLTSPWFAVVRVLLASTPSFGRTPWRTAARRAFASAHRSWTRHTNIGSPSTVLPSSITSLYDQPTSSRSNDASAPMTSAISALATAMARSMFAGHCSKVASAPARGRASPETFQLLGALW